jgi:hypothetical protein
VLPPTPARQPQNNWRWSVGTRHIRIGNGQKRYILAAAPAGCMTHARGAYVVEPPEKQSYYLFDSEIYFWKVKIITPLQLPLSCAPSPFHNLLNLSMPRNKKAKQPVCGLCKLTFVDKTALHNHVRRSRRHLETFGCGLCNRPFLDQNDLELHINAFHPSQSSAATGAAVVDRCAKTSKHKLSPRLSGRRYIF